MITPEFIQPVVLVGGRSRRFGRDKLLAPFVSQDGAEVLVDQPRLALQTVFGPVVWAVGACDPAVARRFQSHVPDAPGHGPIAGLVAAVRAAKAPTFVLSGDLPGVRASTVRRLVAAAQANPDAQAIVAVSTDLEPLIAVYRPSALLALESALNAPQSDPLRRLLTRMHIHREPVDVAEARNVNLESEMP